MYRITKTMYRISVTTIEKFRRFITSASPYDTEAALIETIRGLFKGNDKTRFGSAFGKIIEEGASVAGIVNNQPGYLVDNIFFNEELARPAIEYRAAHPAMIYEVPVLKVYQVDEFDVLLSGRTDGIEGAIVRDVKTKFRSVEVQEYIDSYQWRYYLDMLSVDRFYYDIFEVQGFDQLAPAGITDVSNITIVPHEPVPCLSYPDMESDCIILLGQFFEYIKHRNFFHYLKTVDKTTINL